MKGSTSLWFSQNFLRKPELLQTLLARTSIEPTDTVYDIGAGKGIISAALAERCQTVVSVEIDHALCAKLRQNVQQHANVLVFEADFLQMPLPHGPYKVFANIPFHLSADIVRKLLDAPNPPQACYLIVQKEFAQKLIAHESGRNSQQAIQYGPVFAMRIVYTLSPDDFYPRPGVTPVVLEIVRRHTPLLQPQYMQLYRDFVTLCFNTTTHSVMATLSPLFSPTDRGVLMARLHVPPKTIPSQLTLEQWLGLFAGALAKRAALESFAFGFQATQARKHSHRKRNRRHSQNASGTI